MTAGSGFLTSREAILARDELETEEVEVPEWGGKVLVSELSGTDRSAFEQSLVDLSGGTRKLTLENASARISAMAIVHPETKARLFSDSDVEALGKLSGRALERVGKVAMRLSGLSGKDVEEIVGNSDGPPPDGSSSD